MSPPMLRAARPRQWTKNVLVLAAPAAAGVLDSWPSLWRTLVMFVAFCLASSGTYFWNDLLDVEADRAHPRKRNRPIASGAISIRTARVTGTLLLVSGIALSFTIGRWQAPATLTAYVIVTLAYSIELRRHAVFDIATVASGFVLRAVAGAAATGVPLSSWFLLVTLFGSLFVVTGKRAVELADLGSQVGEVRPAMEQYSVEYLRMVLVMALSASTVTYCIWAFETAEVSGSTFPWYELSIIPMVLALLRYALVLDQGRGAAPEEVFLQDRPLQLCGLIWVVIFAIGVYAGKGATP